MNIPVAPVAMWQNGALTDFLTIGLPSHSGMIGALIWSVPDDTCREWLAFELCAGGNGLPQIQMTITDILEDIVQSYAGMHVWPESPLQYDGYEIGHPIWNYQENGTQNLQRYYLRSLVKKQSYMRPRVEGQDGEKSPVHKSLHSFWILKNATTHLIW